MRSKRIQRYSTKLELPGFASDPGRHHGKVKKYWKYIGNNQIISTEGTLLKKSEKRGMQLDESCKKKISVGTKVNLISSRNYYYYVVTA